MKKIKWKSFILSTIICLSPILFGLSNWNQLADILPIHFNLYGEPDNFASKTFVVFGLPVIMTVVHMICFLIADYKSERNKAEVVTKWITPFLSVALQAVTLGYALGWNIDIRKSVSFIIAVIFLVTGSFLPKSDKVKNYKVGPETARKINRFVGCEMIVIGLLFLVSIFLPPISTVICIIFMIPFTIISATYSIIITKKQK